MDLAFTKDEMAFREEVRQFFKDNVPPETRRKLVEGRHLSKDEMVTWWRILNKKGWGVSHWPKEYGGTGWTLGAALHLQRRAAVLSGAGAARLRRQHGRPCDLHLRQRRAEEEVSAAHRQCRRLVVPGILRARLRLRPRLAEDQGRAQGRQVDHQRPEDLDHARPARRHDLLPLPHRSRGEEADRHLLHRVRHEEQGRHRAPDPDHRRRPSRSTKCSSTTSRCPTRTSSARRTRAGITQNSCSATSAPALPASASPRSGSAASRISPPRSNPTASR